MQSDFQNTTSQFNRTSPLYHQDSVSALHPTHKFTGETTPESQIPKSTASVRIVDGAVRVISTNDRTRKQAIAHFDGLKENTANERSKFKSCRDMGIAATVIGFGIASVGGFGLASLAFNPFVALPLTIGGIAISIFGGLQWGSNQKKIDRLQVNTDDIQQKKGAWKDPIESIISQRKQVGVEGFNYVFKRNLKNTIVHPEEVQRLWQQSLDQLLNSPINLKQAFRDNILSKKAIEYAFSGRQFPPLNNTRGIISPSHLNRMSDRFEEVHQSYNSFQSALDTEKLALDRQYSSLKREIASLRTAWLFPVETIHQQSKVQAKRLYDQANIALTHERDAHIAEVRERFRYVIVNPNNREELTYQSRLRDLCNVEISQINRDFNNHRFLLEIKTIYARDLRASLFLYNQSKNIVDAFFDEKTAKLEKEYKLISQQIDQERSNGEQHFTTLLGRILHSSTESELDHLKISSPITRSRSKLPEQTEEPRWSEVYGNTPRFTSGLNPDISLDTWNLFWGDRGLGLFAAQNRRQWHTLLNNPSLLPDRPDWIHLSGYRRIQRSSIFSRPIVVPPNRFSPIRPPIRGGSVGERETVGRRERETVRRREETTRRERPPITTERPPIALERRPIQTERRRVAELPQVGDEKRGRGALRERSVGRTPEPKREPVIVTKNNEGVPVNPRERRQDPASQTRVPIGRRAV